MKKKIFVSAITLIVFVICSIGIIACSNGGKEHNHVWNKWTADNATTHSRSCDCGESETKAHSMVNGVCTDCSYTDKTSDKHTHKWDNGVITKNATCKETGIKTFTCSECGGTKTEIIEKSTVHSYSQWTSYNSVTHTHTCSVCGKSESDNHNWDNGVTTKKATCKETGIKTYTCADCGQTKTENIEISTIHSYGSWASDDENTHTHTCTVCNKSETANHRWDNGVVTKQPNCKDFGVKTYTCADCGKTKTEDIEKISTHSYGNWMSFDNDTHKHTCSICGETETATHNMAGETCSDCGFSYLPATIISVDNATMDYVNSSIKILVNKTTNTVNLSNMVKISPNSSWKLYTADSSLVATKFANLNDGENNFLIVVSSSDGLYDNTYSLSIYKSFEVSINYYNVYNEIIHSETADTGYKYKVKYTPDITGYTFNCWKLNNKKTTEFVPLGTTNLHSDCTANDYTLTLNPNGGEVEINTKEITFDSLFSLPVPTKTGHTFLGWYADHIQITYDNGNSRWGSKFSTETELIAEWQINSYKLTLKYDNYSHGTVNGSGTYNYDTSVTVTATTKTGYTFIGWYNGDTLLESNLSYTFNMPAENTAYTAKWCKVSTESNNTTAGTVSELNATYIAGNEIEITATTNNGYTFIGWFNGETLLSNDLIYTVQMPSIDTVYTAKWCKVNLNYTSGGEITPSNLSNTYKTGDIINITATTPFLGYIWIGWFNGEILLTTNLDYTFTMPDNDTTYTAKWQAKEDMQMFKFSSTSNTCEIIRLNDKNLMEVIIPDYVTSIGGYACSGCSGLASITIPNSVTSIGNFAFLGCSGLTIYCEATSKLSGWNSDWNNSNCPVVWDCNNNDEDSDGYAYIVENGIRYRIKDNTATVYRQPDIIQGNIVILEKIIYNDSTYNVTSIGSGAFYDCSGLTSMTIPDSVTSIDEYAFSGSGLTSITIPESVTSIGSSTFEDCSGLTSITIPDSVTSIDEYAFSGSGLTSITIPESVTSIGSSAFRYCSGLTSMTIPFVGAIKNSSTNCHFGYIFGASNYLDNSKCVPTGLKTVIITDGSLIGDYAFYGCSGLTNITIPDSVTSIDNYVFRGCTGLMSITVNPENTVYHSEGNCLIETESKILVLGCKSSVIPSDGSVTEIGSNAFEDCSGLTSITIPDSVTAIGQYAFDGCSGVIQIGNGIKYVDKWVVGYSGNYKELKLRIDTVGICNNAFEGCNSLINVTIPENVKYIGDFAFCECSRLSSITIPDSVTSIGYVAFYGCSELTSITIPDSIAYIGGVAFDGCSNLQFNNYDNALYLGNSSNPYLVLVKTKDTNITSCTINENTKLICGSAFAECESLTSITVPVSVTNIGDGAFYGCSGLTIYCEATSKPNGWNSSWNYSNCPVVWDCKNKS